MGVSCVKKEEDKYMLQLYKNMLNVYCVISPHDSILSAMVYFPQPYFSNSSSDILPEKNATIQIYNNTDTFLLNPPLPDQANYYYVLPPDKKIKEGEVYYLKVELQDKTLTSSCVVPKRKKIESIELISNEVKINFEVNKVIKYSVNFEEGDYLGYQYNFKTENIFKYGQTDSIKIDEKMVNFDIEKEMFLKSPLLIHDSLIILRRTVSEFKHIMAEFIFSLQTYDEHYYKYFQSKQLNANPNREPIHVYSNITGGHGVFGAYVIDKKNLITE